MDTRTLVVGQEVKLSSGIYGINGEVVKVTPSGVIVQLINPYSVGGNTIPDAGPGPQLVRFGIDGKAANSNDIYVGNLFSMGLPGDPEGGPWEIDPW